MVDYLIVSFKRIIGNRDIVLVDNRRLVAFGEFHFCCSKACFWIFKSRKRNVVISKRHIAWATSLYLQCQSSSFLPTSENDPKSSSRLTLAIRVSYLES